MNRRWTGVLNNILDCPDEILTQIISHLNARERLALSKTCRKFDNLIFNQKKYLRDLDFSEDGYLTAVSDVQEYFTDKIRHEYIRKINVSNIYCTNDREVLQGISKAKKIVELDIRGFKFQDFEEFGNFLEPFKKLKRFSGDWPTGQENFSPWNKYLKVPFGRLTYLSITLCNSLDKWTLVYALALCLKLEELHLIQTHPKPESRRSRFWMQMPAILEELKKVVCCGCETGIFHTIVKDMVPDPFTWANLLRNDPSQTEYFYFEKDMKIAPELEEYVRMTYDMWNPNEILGWHFHHDRLLREVFDSPENEDPMRLMFLYRHCFLHRHSCCLNVEDAKLLAEFPEHQISYLNLYHDMEPECNVKIIATAFPTLKKLVLNNIIKQKNPPLCKKFETGIKRRRQDSEESKEEGAGSHPSFKKLVDDIRELEELSLCASSLRGYADWDLDALNLIAGWKNLKTLYLGHVPIVDGQFLIEIGKQCTNLEKLRLENLGSRLACCYKDGLIEMLPHCQSLKDFSIQQNNFPGVHNLFDTLSRNLKLRRLCVQCLGRKKSVVKILKPIDILTRTCNLVLFVCEIKGMTQAISEILNSSLQRLKTELNRPLFQFEILVWIGAKKPSRNVSLELVHKDLMFPQHYNDALYRMGCQ